MQSSCLVCLGAVHSDRSSDQARGDGDWILLRSRNFLRRKCVAVPPTSPLSVVATHTVTTKEKVGRSTLAQGIMASLRSTTLGVPGVTPTSPTGLRCTTPIQWSTHHSCTPVVRDQVAESMEAPARSHGRIDNNKIFRKW